jgi:hypothetical protein
MILFGLDADMHGGFRASKSPHKLTSVYVIPAAAVILRAAAWLIDTEVYHEVQGQHTELSHYERSDT